MVETKLDKDPEYQRLKALFEDARARGLNDVAFSYGQRAIERGDEIINCIAFGPIMRALNAVVNGGR